MLFFKLFTELGINVRFWLIPNDIYSEVTVVVCHSELSCQFDVTWDTGQGRILALFIYKVYVNGI